MKQTYLTIFVLVLSAGFFSGCDLLEDEVADNPVPVLSSISPESRVSYLADFTLTVTGSNFMTGSKILFNGVEHPTQYVSETELTCQIDSGSYSFGVSGIRSGEVSSVSRDTGVPVLVRNPTPGGGDSAAINFNVLNNHSFGSPQQVSGNTGKSDNPDIGLDDSGNVYIVFEDYSSNSEEVYCVKSSDSGGSWGQPAIISGTTANESRIPRIAVEASDIVHVVWQEAVPNGRIYYRKSTDAAVSWHAAVEVNGTGWGPVIAFSDTGELQTVWSDPVGSVSDIFASRSTDTGTTWDPPVNISNNNTQSSSPDISICPSGNINVVWYNYLPDEEIYFSRSTSNGAQWNQPRNLSNTTSESLRPAVSTDSNGFIYAVWDDELPNEEVYVSFSTTGGSSWTPVTQVSSNTGRDPVVAVDGTGNINVAWLGYATNSSPSDIFFSRSVDQGVSWSSAVNVSNSSRNSRAPAIAVDDSGYVYIVWYDGNRNVYFSSSLP